METRPHVSWELMNRIVDGIQNPVTKVDVLKETVTTAVFDANAGIGMVASHLGMETAIEKANKYGLSMVAVRNSTHYGIAGYWATMATKVGMIGMTGTNARPSIAPTFGVENIADTNVEFIAAVAIKSKLETQLISKKTKPRA